MTQTVGTSKVLIAIQEQQPHLHAEHERLQAAHRAHQQDRARLQQELAAAWQHLTQILVPELVPEHLDLASRTLALPSVAAPTVATELRREREALEAELLQREQLPEVARAEAILNEVSIHLSELDESIAPLEASVRTFEALPGWRELIDSGYGTAAYIGKWYTLSYYRHWKHGDHALESLGAQLGLTEFDGLRSRYIEHELALKQLQASRHEQSERREQILGAQQQHASLRERLDHLEARYLGIVRGRVHQHVAVLPPSELLPRLSVYDLAVVALKRIHGLQAKERYLEQIHAQWITAPLFAAAKAIAKNNRDLVKLSRSKYAWREFPMTDYERRFQDRRKDWDERHEKYIAARDRLLTFDAYDRYDFHSTVIWWSLMTNDEVKARFIPEVADYYRTTFHFEPPGRDSGVQVRLDPEDDAVLAVAQDRDDHSSTTGHTRWNDVS